MPCQNIIGNDYEFSTPDGNKKIRYADHYDIAENMSNKDILLEKGESGLD